MKSRLYLAVMVILALSLLVGAGCAKKTTTSAPPESKVEIKDNSTWTPPPPPKEYEAPVSEATLAAEEAARKKSAALEELTSLTIHFDFDSYELGEEARGVLGRKADLMRSYDTVKVVIEGHCDERGTEEYNLALGERRARAAYEHLVILGVDPERMSIVSFGEERPVDPAHNESAWAQNRRAEFVVQ